MSLSTYCPDSGHLQSEAGPGYHFDVGSEDNISHVLIGVVLTDLVEGRKTLQECYESIKTNFDLTCNKFEEEYK